MVSVIGDLARKEILSYYRSKPAIIRNILMLAIFSVVPIQQIHAVLVSGGYTASALTGALEYLLLFASFYAVVVSSTISAMAFPLEKDQKTIEHLLSLPLTDGEIFLGKVFAAVISGLLSLAFIFSIIVGYTFFADGSRIVWDSGLLTPSLILVVFLLAPMVVVLSVFLIVAVSGFVSSTNEAYMSSFVVLGVLLGLIFAKAYLPVEPLIFNLLLLAVLLTAIFLAYFISVKTFNRERLISRA
ncbi:ABC transporter [Methanocella sp. CWC-04]|uniref:ABC transporter n=1 Tax=Methanooceanicella nereidis TaxID=2052831 RepID=A0AAP2W7N5_9EURY|nr:ABC transporter permease subunit [Methanocella sp. CWC-04]MCD1295241.1 ABC transporter [Methanocella sp. CWC-04]